MDDPAAIAASMSPAKVTLTAALDVMRVAILTALCDVPHPGWCMGLRGLGVRAMGLPDEVIRAIVRDLRACGLAEYHKGLWTEDGMPGGAGYAITPLGRAVLAEIEKGHTE